jgi:hypothetical protein
MNLRDTILIAHSKANCTKIVTWVGSNQKRFDELFNLFLKDEYRVVQRAGWPVSYCAMAHPEFMKKNFGKLLKNLKRPGMHEAVKRNTVRLLQDLAYRQAGIPIPKKYQGEIMSLCFDYISSPTEKIAIKAFSLTVLQNLSKIYPDIKQELVAIINDRWDFETAAFRSRAKKILNSH